MDNLSYIPHFSSQKYLCEKKFSNIFTYLSAHKYNYNSISFFFTFLASSCLQFMPKIGDILCPNYCLSRAFFDKNHDQIAK